MLKFLRLTLLLLSICCFNNILIAQVPANDNCADAIAITLDEVVTFTNVDATRDGPFQMDSPCANGTAGGAADTIFADVWYAYTASITGEVVWSLCGTTDFDSRIAVYAAGASCPVDPADLLDCNEDGPGASCPNFESELIFDVEEGMTYLLRLGGFGPGDGTIETGSGTFTVEEFVFDGPANSFCEDAIALEFGTHEFTTIGSITDGPDHPDDPGCFGFGSITAGTDIWFTYTADFTGSVEWSTCDMINFDSRLVVYGPNVSCPVSADQLYACNDDGAACDNFTSYLIFDVVEGDSYLLRLGGFGSEAGVGTFTFMDIIPPTPPANDECDGALQAMVISRDAADNFDVIHEGTTTNSTIDNSNFVFPACVTNTAGGEFADVWFKFNTLGNTELEFRANVVTPGAAFFVDVWPSCGETITDTTLLQSMCLDVGDDNPEFLADTLANLPAEDMELYVHVVTRVTGDITGDFWIQIVGDVVSGISPALELKDFTFYPNPVSHQASINFGLSTSAKVELEIHNAIGQLVYSENKGRMAAGQQAMQLDMTDLQNGIYFLTIKGDGKQHISRFVKN